MNSKSCLIIGVDSLFFVDWIY